MSSSNFQSDLDIEEVDGLLDMLDEHNPLVKVFRMARDRFKETDFHLVKIRLLGKRKGDSTQYNLPSASEVAAIIVGDRSQSSGDRDIVVEEYGVGLRKIKEIHPSFMAMQYPILFPYGEDFNRTDIEYVDADETISMKRKFVTFRDTLAFRLQQRHEEGETVIRGGRLFQQFSVDGFTFMEDELYNGLKGAVVRGDTTPASLGRRFILPSSFTGSPRYMVQYYQDAMAICRWTGTPDIFLTFTCNPKWKEIKKFLDLIPGRKLEDRPDIAAMVFKIKLDELINDLRTGKHFGDDTAVHAGYNAVVQYMVHGPYGAYNKNSPCMDKDKCTKHYLKSFRSQTIANEDGFPIYKRRDDRQTALKNGVEVDNRWIVPHNVDLVVKYDAHINVEHCNQGRSIKYLFKYINRGHDRATFTIEENASTNNETGVPSLTEVDEIKRYLDCRYVSASEACWRIFKLDIQYRDPAVERFSFHLSGEHNVIFGDNDSLVDIVNRAGVEKTIFTEWMRANQLFQDARHLTYAEFPMKWTWKKDLKQWKRRGNGRCIRRIYYAHSASGERYYLRLLLNIVRGPTSFEDIRTIDGILYPTFKEASAVMGLLDNDDEWHEAIKEASQWASGHQLRQLFVTLILFCEVTEHFTLWIRNWEILSEDILY
ncbi:uncharacterized protein LOC111279552 [Durio zibethinus]|uniref:Uncharacterized protein LOC111279552 n=1 Tax=Durio zibethinus TaxID=66656 RepID=A0A6P5X324_DURZI|nr:uncharacterized protein LOC111279552 [Durio zibethinus]